MSPGAPTGFDERLMRFLGSGVDHAEARDLALAVASRSIRDTKVAVAERLWLAEQASAAGDSAAEDSHMQAALALRDRYRAAMAEYERLLAGAGHTPAASAIHHGTEEQPAAPDGPEEPTNT